MRDPIQRLMVLWGIPQEIIDYLLKVRVIKEAQEKSQNVKKYDKIDILGGVLNE